MKNENQIQPRRASAEPATYDRAKWRATIITATFAASVEGNTQADAAANAAEMVAAWNNEAALREEVRALHAALKHSTLWLRAAAKEYPDIAENLEIRARMNDKALAHAALVVVTE